jgi:hypothetical protein
MAATRKTATPENTSHHVAPKRGERGKWLPGQSPNPGGRPRVIGDVRNLARQHTDTAIEALVTIATSGQAEAARVSAAQALLDRGWGRPAQVLAGDPENPVGIEMVTAEEIARRRAAAQAVLNAAFGEDGNGGGPA